MPNAIKMLTDDHRKVKALFEEYDSGDTNDLDTKKQVTEESFKELEVHTKLEEEIFYPTVQEKTEREEVKELVEHSEDEHKTVKNIISDLRTRGVEEEGFDTVYRQLMADVRHHITEEEEDLFPKVEDEMADQIEEMGEKMEARRKELI